MSHGEIPPNEVALAVLFANRHQCRLNNRRSRNQRKSKGLDRAMFTRYDYLIFFNHSNVATVERLREAIRVKEIRTVQQGKGKTTLLGEYGRQSTQRVGNLIPMREPIPRADWDKTMEYQSVVQGFLEGGIGRE
jgi:hypothetical protein